MMKDEKIDLTRFSTSKGVLARLFYWKYSRRKIEYKDFSYRSSGRCPVCQNVFLEEYGSEHVFTDHRHTQIEIYYNCVFCGFYSRFVRTRGFDDIQTFASILYQFSCFDIDELNSSFKFSKDKVSPLTFLKSFLSSKTTKYDIYQAKSDDKSKYDILFFRVSPNGFSYAMKVSKDINIENPFECIDAIFYPEILWDKEVVIFVFSKEINMVVDFKEADEIFSFIGCYNKNYPAFYKISDEMKKEMMIYNINYYYSKNPKQYMREIVYNGEVIYDEKEAKKRLELENKTYWNDPEILDRK